MRRFVIVSLLLVVVTLAYERTAAPTPSAPDPSVPGAVYEPGDVPNGGTIKGHVAWVGDVPPEKKFTVSKDPEICGAHGPEKVSPRLKIGADRGVKDTIVYLVGVTKGKPFPAGTKFKIDQKTCEYIPHILIAPKGADVEVGSSDDVLHNVHLTGAVNANVALPDAKANPTVLKMKKVGLVDISCDNGHVWMSGTIMVVLHPYVAATDEKGDFALTDVPPGKYQIVAWHEGWDIVKTDEKDGVITRYYYSDPITVVKDVEVKEKAEAVVPFEIGAKK